MKTFVKIIVMLTIAICSANAQQIEWAKELNSSFTATGNSMALDANSNIYVTGYFQDTLDADPGTNVNNIISNGFIDFFFAKYDKDGKFIYAKSFGGINEEYVYGMTLDKNGNIYLIGTIRSTVDFDPGPDVHTLTNTPNLNTLFFAKYTKDGNYIYAYTLPNNSNLNTISGICSDDNENLFIAGSFTTKMDFNPGTGTAEITPKGKIDGFIAKYDKNGNYAWAKNMDGSGSIGTAVISEICIDNTGNIYATGYFKGTIDFDPGVNTQNLTSITSNEDIFYAKYDKDGNYIFAKSLGSINADKGKSIATDETGNIYLSGTLNQTIDMDPGTNTHELTCNGDLDIFFAKYDSDGNYIYANSIGSIQADEPYKMRVKPSGELYITGYFRVFADFDPGPNMLKLTSAGYGDIYLARYDKNGNIAYAGNMGGLSFDQGWDLGFYNNYVYLYGDFGNTADFDPGKGAYELTAKKVSALFIAKYLDIYTSLPSASDKPNLNIYSSGNILYISSNEGKVKKVSVYNLTGEKIRDTFVLTGNNNKINLNLSPGLYIIKVEENNIQYSIKAAIVN